MVTDWQLISFIKSSKYREKVLEALEKPMTPTEIKKQIHVDKAHVTRALQSLMKNDLVICHTPDVRKHKIFERTAKGNLILKNWK